MDENLEDIIGDSDGALSPPAVASEAGVARRCFDDHLVDPDDLGLILVHEIGRAQITAVTDHHLDDRHGPIDLYEWTSEPLPFVDNTRDLHVLGTELAFLGTRNETVRHSLISIQDRTFEALVAYAAASLLPDETPLTRTRSRGGGATLPARPHASTNRHPTSAPCSRRSRRDATCRGRGTPTRP